MDETEPSLLRDLSTGDMKADWNRRAQVSARAAILSHDRGDEAFRASGEADAAFIRGLLGDADRSGWRAIDYGCGIGRLVEPLSRDLREVIGVDISDEMVRQASERLAGNPRVRFQALANDGRLPFPDGSFDLAWSVYVFQHLPRAAFHSAMKEISRVVRPGGTFLVHLNYPYTLKRKVQALLRKDQTPQETYRRRFYTEGELRSTFERCGLRCERMVRNGNKGQHAWYLTRRVGAEAGAEAGAAG